MTSERRARLERIHFDTVDALRAIDGGRPCPEHLLRHMRENTRAAAWRMIRRRDDALPDTPTNKEQHVTTLTVIRTQPEIFARAQAADDMFGWAQEVLLPYLDFEHAKPILNDGVTAEKWLEYASASTGIGEAAREYYVFALGKIEDERGISAERSVIKLREYAWLMGRDDVVAAMDAAPYPQYGAPKVAAFGEGLGFTADPS